ncbi:MULTISPECIES: hypothetical protein [unclassified Fibrobacter]|uniref:hypothetical protein n=1 Tax=unclassified Fibrobacter TaxID=2634177 RepID=UPI000D6C76AA|nr:MULTISPECIES: hypothetical protein [unclassified Fibrobacter]PWJ68262.1 hypothetical protein BGX12_10984 [Fibrobacter sp. UWR4]PZW72620.1 hypothetical protein C8E88_100684 [Fibrobacter sp. UWR1]
MKLKFLLIFMIAAVSSYAAQIKDVKFTCDNKGCRMAFAFASEKDLPTFFQKYDAKNGKLTLAFSESSFALGEGNFDIENGSKFVRAMRVYHETFRGSSFLKFEMDVGAAINSDKNAISMNKSDFVLSFKSKGGKSWTMSKIFADRKKAADKQAALDKKAAEKQAALDKKAAAKAAAEEKKRLAEEKKAAEKQAALDKKAAEKAALEEKKRLAEEKKAAEKAAAEEEKRIAEMQKQLDKAMKEGGASALLPGIKEMTVLIGSGMEQFRIVTEIPISLSNVSGPDKSSAITIGIEGPKKSPLFKIGAGSLVKAVTWTSNGIRLQLQTGVNPVMLVQEGALILQVAETAIKKDGFIFWSAQPKGIFSRDWMKSAEEKPDFNAFVKKWESESKKIVSSSQSFHLRPVIRELIVVADEIEFYAAPNENAQVLQRLVFGDRLVSLDINGLYRKVQTGNRIGYVNKRAVSFFDELSSVQAERLKQVDKERGTESGSAVAVAGSQLDALYEDRVTYSSFGRRDPFVNIKGLVEEGINVDQVELMGIIWESEVPMAILVESKDPSVSYTVKEGDKILNGKVLKITQTDVLFLIQEFGVSRRYSMGLPDKFGGNK